MYDTLSFRTDLNIPMYYVIKRDRFLLASLFTTRIMWHSEKYGL